MQQKLTVELYYNRPGGSANIVCCARCMLYPIPSNALAHHTSSYIAVSYLSIRVITEAVITKFYCIAKLLSSSLLIFLLIVLGKLFLMYNICYDYELQKYSVYLSLFETFSQCF